MPLTKIDSLIEEFPWIRKYVRRCDYDRVFVTVVEPEILEYKCQVHSEPSDYMDPGVFIRENLWLLDKNGDLVSRKYEQRVEKASFFGFGRTVPSLEQRVAVGELGSSSFAQTVELLGEATDKVTYLLSHFQITRTVIVYKIPYKKSLKEWLVLLKKPRVQLPSLTAQIQS